MENFMSLDISSLALALSKFQGQVGPIAKKKKVKVKSKSTGTEYEYYYADLADIRDATQKPLADNELSICQTFCLIGNKNYISTLLLHSSGQWIKSLLEIADHDKIQELGSEMTYLRRYGLSAILGIVTEDDEDGQIANETPRKTNETQKTAPTPAPDLGSTVKGWKPASRPKQDLEVQREPAKIDNMGKLKYILLEKDVSIEHLEEYLFFRSEKSGYTIEKTVEAILQSPDITSRFVDMYKEWMLKTATY